MHRTKTLTSDFIITHPAGDSVTPTSIHPENMPIESPAADAFAPDHSDLVK